ncbi:MAG TPA: alkaline phosphatase D family protein [Thermoanaerobaculia bacterium]|nr:alkaline phosphatase D family protein [Thermoanaerobaculia bacterium]
MLARSRRVGRLAIGVPLALAILASAACGNGWASREPVATAGAAAALHATGSPVEWVWVGALQPTSTVVKARLRGALASSARLAVAEDLGFENVRHVDGEPGQTDPSVVTFTVDGLVPGRDYHYAVEVGSQLQLPRAGHFTTPEEGPFSFTIALGACAQTGSNHPVFDEIRSASPLLFLHLGDFHYENVSSRDPDLYRRAYDRVLASSRQSALFRSMATAYVWDDHDFTGNNSDRSTLGRVTARQVYREVVPHYPLAAGDGDQPIHQSFVLGRVLFVVTDTRSERTPHRFADGPRKTMLGAAQKAWLFDRLDEAPRFGLVVWVNTLPWIAPPRPTADDWGGYAEERREIAERIAERGITNLVMLSGDAHMLAMDDGTNNGYAGEGKPGFPVLHSGALDRNGSVKGGPYSEGTFPGRGQYALMRVEDEGGERIRVRWSGRRHGVGELVALELEIQVPPTPRH